MNEIRAEIRRIFVNEFEVEPERLVPEALLGADLGLDSLDAVDLVVAIKDAFGCRISEEEARSMKSLADVYEYLESYAGVSAGGARS